MEEDKIRKEKRQSYKGPVKCYYCKKPGHKEASCWKKEEDEQKGDQKSNFVENEQKLFLAQRAADNDAGGDVWYIDSGCSELSVWFYLLSFQSRTKEIEKQPRGNLGISIQA